MYSHFTAVRPTTQGAFGIGGTNATGQVPEFMPNFPSLIDVKTPQEAYTKPSFADSNDQWELVFSDEFEVDGPDVEKRETLLRLAEMTYNA